MAVATTADGRPSVLGFNVIFCNMQLYLHKHGLNTSCHVHGVADDTAYDQLENAF